MTRADLELQLELGRDAADASVLEALVSAGRAATPTPELRSRLLATVARPTQRFAPLYGALAELFDLRDAALAALFERAEVAREWVDAPIPGTRLLHLQGGPSVAGADCGLVHVAAGATFPHHRHLGGERALVLSGAYRDEPSGKIYRSGDWHEMSPGSSHAYVALPDRDLLLAVAVSEGIHLDGIGPFP